MNQYQTDEEKLANWTRSKEPIVDAKGQVMAWDLSETGQTAFRLTAEWQQLRRLDLSNNALQEVVLDMDMPELEFLNISRNEVALKRVVLKGRFPKLKYIFIYQSQLEKLEWEASMPNLSILNLAENQLKQFTVDLVEDAPNLEDLNLSGNPIENTAIKSYLEDRNKCIETIRDYQKAEKEHGVGADNECKVLLIGNGGVGKSCFAERLVHDRFTEEWNSTHGILIQQYLLRRYVLNLWDFGGQDIYHATHRLFMQSNSVYLLFWDWKTEHSPTTKIEEAGEIREYQNHDLWYWLAYTKSQGKGSPCIVIQTKTLAAGHGKRDAPQQSALREQFGDIIQAFTHIDSAEADEFENGYEDVLHYVCKSVRKLKTDGKIAQNYIDLRQAIRMLQEKLHNKTSNERLLSWDAYQQLAHDCGFQDDAAVTPLYVLENWLVKTGVVYYREGLMGNQIILDQLWAIEAIYLILDRTQFHYAYFQQQKGIVAGKMLHQIWSATQKYTESDQGLFIDFMLSCDLCFETTPESKEAERHRNIPLVERTFVVPQLLPEKSATNIEDLCDAVGESAWYYRFEHPFLHYGIIQQFIIKAQVLADLRDIWKMGIYLKEGKTQKAVVQAISNKQIDIKVNQTGKRLLDKILNTFRSILQYETDTVESVSLDGEHYVRLTELKAEHRSKENKTIRSIDGQKVLLQDLWHFLETDEREQFKTKTQQYMAMEKEIKQLFIEDDLEGAIDLYMEHYDTDNTILLASRINAYNKTLERGTSTPNENNAERAKLRQSFLFNFKKDTGVDLSKVKIEKKKVEVNHGSDSSKSKTRKILFIAASPESQSVIRSDFEYSEIEKQIIASTYRDNFELKNVHAITDDKLMKVLDAKPEILHFAGHGIKDGIYVQDGQNQPLLITTDALEFTFDDDEYKKHLKTIIFNSCYSEYQAKALSKLGYEVIGFRINNRQKIEDRAAILFATGFYLGLGENADTKRACRNGKKKLLFRLGSEGVKSKDIEIYIWKGEEKTAI